MSYRVAIEYGGRRRLVGRVVDLTLVCNRNEIKHMFRGGRSTVEEAKKDGTASWGLDCKVCDGLIEKGVIWWEVHGTVDTYRAKLVDVVEKGYVLNMHNHRPQYFLNIEEFEKE